jgi:hypothetical protein
MHRLSKAGVLMVRKHGTAAHYVIDPDAKRSIEKYPDTISE